LFQLEIHRHVQGLPIIQSQLLGSARRFLFQGQLLLAVLLDVHHLLVRATGPMQLQQHLHVEVVQDHKVQGLACWVQELDVHLPPHQLYRAQGHGHRVLVLPALISIVQPQESLIGPQNLYIKRPFFLNRIQKGQFLDGLIINSSLRHLKPRWWVAIIIRISS
jgi:hypothetical protein